MEIGLENLYVDRGAKKVNKHVTHATLGLNLAIVIEKCGLQLSGWRKLTHTILN